MKLATALLCTLELWGGLYLNLLKGVFRAELPEDQLSSGRLPRYRILSNNQTLADAHSRSTDRGPICRVAAISSTDNPAK